MYNYELIFILKERKINFQGLKNAFYKDKDGKLHIINKIDSDEEGNLIFS